MGTKKKLSESWNRVLCVNGKDFSHYIYLQAMENQKNNQVQKVESRELSVKELPQSLIVAMEEGDKQTANLILRRYKLQNGAVNYPMIFNINSGERIPQLAKQDFRRINMLIIGALTVAFEAMNLKRGMNEMQILDLAEAIIDTSSEDNLSLEDIMLFLQNMVRGKYEMSYESLDIPKFMKLFEIYRQERHSAMLEIRENQHLQFKGLGSAERSAKEDSLSEHFANFGGTLNTLRQNMMEMKKENQKLKDIDKF